MSAAGEANHDADSERTQDQQAEVEAPPVQEIDADVRRRDGAEHGDGWPVHWFSPRGVGAFLGQAMRGGAGTRRWG